MTGRYPDLKNSVILCVLFLVFQIFVSLFMMKATDSKGLMVIFSVVIPPLMIIGMAARANHATLARTLDWRPAQRKTIIPLILMTVSLAFIVSETENLVVQYLIPPEIYRQYLRQFMDLFFFENRADLVFGLLSIALVGPFMEEVVFRGVIFRGIASQQGRGPAVVASSVLFMVVHVNPLQFPGALILGLLYATMISRGYRISDTFLAHALHNTISLTFLLGALDIPGMNPAHGGEVTHVSAGVIAGSLVVLSAALSVVLRWAPGTPEGEEGAARAGG